MIRAFLLLAWPLASSIRLDEEVWPRLKLVINSNRKYEIPLRTLMDTMKSSGFQNWTDVIVVIGGAEDNRIYQKGDLTYMETKLMNFDLTGLAMLNRHRDHPLIRAEAYMYMLDTSTVGAGFPFKFTAMARTEHKEFRSSPRPASNVGVFGRGVVEAYGRNFDTALTKQDGLEFEYGHNPHGVHQLEEFAEKVTQMQPRVEHGDAIDIYHTGYPRRVFWYPDLDVFKYILWEHTGDIEGNVHRLQNLGDSETKAYWWHLWKFLTGWKGN
ncbi:unnamed protein product [Effrenium voratum]|nr:unnamed protein product [Effrenium voratum]